MAPNSFLLAVILHTRPDVLASDPCWIIFKRIKIRRHQWQFLSYLFRLSDILTDAKLIWLSVMVPLMVSIRKQFQLIICCLLCCVVCLCYLSVLSYILQLPVFMTWMNSFSLNSYLQLVLNFFSRLSIFTFILIEKFPVYCWLYC